jgi:hypothetical protein
MIAGDLEFSAAEKGRGRIVDSYRMVIEIPEAFPAELAAAREIGGRIPRSFHINPDGSLCLGSPIRIRLKIGRSPTLLEFVERCVIPFLYGFSYYERHDTLPNGELAHGHRGLLQDYTMLFGVKDADMCLRFLQLTGMLRRKANRHPCPCGSGSRLGKCHNHRVNRLRGTCGRLLFRDEYNRLACSRLEE